MEAKRTAEQARRIALERAALATQVPAATISAQQQGLPQGSTWGSVASKGWKPVVPVVATTPSPGKKSMAQIQKEEEEERARLAKAKEVVPGLGAGVRGYAGAAAAASTAKVFLPFFLWGVADYSLRCRLRGRWLGRVVVLNLVDRFTVGGLILILLVFLLHRLLLQ